MADTTFVDYSTVVPAAWLNDVNDYVYNQNSPNVGFIQLGTGAVRRVLNTKVQETSFSITDFGALADGTTGTTTSTAIDVAISAANVLRASGVDAVVIDVPAGEFFLSSTHTLTVSKVKFRGTGRATSKFTRSGNYGSTFVFTGVDGTGTYLTDTGITGVTIESTGLTTSGAHIYANGVSRLDVEDVNIFEGFKGVQLDGVTASHVNRVYCVFTQLFGGSATGRKLLEIGTASTNYSHPHCGDLFITDTNWRGNIGTNIFDYCIHIKAADGIWFNGGHVGNAGLVNVLFTNGTAGYGGNMNLVFFNSGFMFDEGLGSSVKFEGSTNAISQDIHFAGCQIKGGSTCLYGVEAAAGALFRRISFNDTDISEFMREGVTIQSTTCNEWDFTDARIMGNSLTGSAAYQGAIIVAAADGIRFKGGRAGGNISGSGAGFQSFGIAFGAGCTNCEIDGVDLRGNVTGPASFASTGVTFRPGLTDQSSSVVAAATTTLPVTHDVVTITGNTGITGITGSYANRRVTLIFTGTPTVTDGGNLLLNGNFVATANDTLSLVANGGNWIETARSAN